MDVSESRSDVTENSQTAVAQSSVVIRYSSIGLILLLWFAIYFASSFSPALLDDVDTVHAEAAREMVLRHDWVTLYTDGIRYLEKAPLMYWAVAASYKVFGISEWSTRLPLILGVLALLFVTYYLGSMAYGERGGLYAAVVLATSLGPYMFTRFQIPDAIVGLWMALSAVFFLKSLQQERPSVWVCWGFAATCALNVLTKSLIGLVFPFGAILLYLILTRNLRYILKLRLISSTIVFLLIAAPWHVLAALRNPTQVTSAGTVKGFLWFYFVNEQFLRYVGKRVPPGYDTVPLLIFWALTILWIAPWMVFLPPALRRVPLKLRQWREQLSREQQMSLFFLIWAVVIVGFFTFSTRQEYYTIPAVPALALLVGGWLMKESSAPEVEGRGGRIASWVLFVIVLLGSVVGVALLLSSKPAPAGSDLADLLKKNPQDYNFSLGHFLDLTPEALGKFRPQLLGAILSLFVGAGLNLILRYKRKPAYGNVILAGMMVALLACVHSAFVIFSPILSSKPLAAAIEKYYMPGDVIVVDGQYHEASTLNFYLETRIRVLHVPSGNLWYGAKFPDAPHVFETPQSFDQLWDSPTTVFVWTDQDNPKELAGMPHYLLARAGAAPVTIVVLVLVAVNLGTIVFSFLAILAAQRYRAAVPPALNALEPISILKPLAGLDDALESNLRTFFAQDYPDFEILFAVREAHDPALAVVRQLQQEHPQIRTELFVTGEPPYPNAKVFSLDLMLSKAANDLVVMSDSDIRVTPTLLRTVAAEFQDPALGVATCPYRAVPGESIWSRLEATGMNTDFIAGMLVARMLEGVKFAVGPTIAARRHVLQAIGGFDRLKEYLAEDFMMGKLAAEAGHGVILSSYVIEHHIGNSSFHQNLTHRLRWVRSTRRSRPAGYIGQLFTMPLPIAVALLIANHHWWPVSALAIVIRLVAAYMMSRKVLRARLNWLLLPLEDFFGFFCWIAGFWGKTIHWRGRDYLLFSDGTFKPLPSAVSTTSPQARQG